VIPYCLDKYFLYLFVISTKIFFNRFIFCLICVITNKTFALFFSVKENSSNSLLFFLCYSIWQGLFSSLMSLHSRASFLFSDLSTKIMQNINKRIFPKLVEKMLLKLLVEFMYLLRLIEVLYIIKFLNFHFRTSFPLTIIMNHLSTIIFLNNNNKLNV